MLLRAAVYILIDHTVGMVRSIPPSQLSEDYLQWRASKGIREGFWAPRNDFDCNLNSFTAKEKFFLREYDKYPVGPPGTAKQGPYKVPDFKPHSPPRSSSPDVPEEGHKPRRPATAPADAAALAAAARGIKGLDHIVK